MKWLWRGLAALTLLLVLVAGGGYLWLRTSLPRIDGEVAVRGLTAPVEVIRDCNGIPHIRAEAANDAYFALGFVHAQDRLWQMDMSRRVGAGRLSEVVGAAGLELDRLMRTLGIYRLAERDFHQLSPELRGAIIAYTDGVNAFLARRRGTLPPAFHLLDYEPEPWVPADSLVWGKLMAMQLSRDWREELLRAHLALLLGPDRILDLFPDAAADRPTILSAAVPAPDPFGQGASNAWVVDGRHSATGRPILANDPHLGLRLPGIWYLARIEAPGLDVTGATTPGVPLTLLGHNGHIAWGMTASQADVEDLFVERLDPDDANAYLTPDGPRPFETREELIGVKDGATETLTVRATRHGPVISDALSGAAEIAGEGAVLALSAPYLLAADRSAEAIFRLDRARDWDEFVAALADFQGLQQNVLYADTSGNIGFYAPGRVPIRRAGDGYLPADGRTGEGDWTGFIPFDRLPHALNPPAGRLASANNRPAGRDYPYFLGRTWAAPYRAERLGQLLDGFPRMGTDEAAKMQADDLSLMALDLLPLMLDTVGRRDGRAGEALAALRRWDARMAAGRPEPLVFTAWVWAARRAILADELGDDFAAYRGLRPKVLKSILGDKQAWCDDTATAAVEDCGARLSLALDRALATLAAAHGDDMAAWRWGKAHQLALTHRVYARIPLLEDLFSLRFPASGGAFTIHRAASFGDDGSGAYPVGLAASMRAVYDLGDLGESLWMPATGQSGNPLSSHFLDLAERWRDFDYLRIADTREAALSEAEGVLMLIPDDSRQSP